MHSAEIRGNNLENLKKKHREKNGANFFARDNTGSKAAAMFCVDIELTEFTF